MASCSSRSEEVTSRSHWPAEACQQQITIANHQLYLGRIGGRRICRWCTTLVHTLSPLLAFACSSLFGSGYNSCQSTSWNDATDIAHSRFRMYSPSNACSRSLKSGMMSQGGRLIRSSFTASESLSMEDVVSRKEMEQKFTTLEPGSLDHN
jgi:hypothetical protein